MLSRILSLPEFSRSAILSFASVRQQKQLQEFARYAAGKKIVHISATAKGGGVAELLKSLIPYLRAFGIAADWYAIDSQRVPQDFFHITNRFHNAFQGLPDEFTKEEWSIYEDVNSAISQELDAIPYDIAVIHDFQPAGAIAFRKKHLPSVLQIHMDTSHTREALRSQVFPIVTAYDQIVFSNRAFVFNELPKERVRVFQPAIDPLAAKQNIIPAQKAKKELSKFGISPMGPLIVQVSRFDI